MKSIIIALALLFSVAGKAQDYNSMAIEAVRNNDFFSLRDVCQQHADEMNPLVLKFVRPIADMASHRHEEAEAQFNDFFANYASEFDLSTLMAEAYFASRNYDVMQKYAEAADLCQQIVDIVESIEDVPDNTADGFRMSTKRFSELAKYPAMTVDAKPEGWTIPMVADTLATTQKSVVQIGVDGTMNGKPMHALFDTGAGSNVIRLSYARQLGLKMIDANVTLVGGGAVEAGMAIADEMTIGDMKLHNVLFVVSEMSTGNEEADKASSITNVIIGRPCMQMMQEFTMDFEKMLITVPGTPVVYDNPNMTFSPDNYQHYVRCEHDGEPIVMNIDTGNLGEWGKLDASYYNAHRTEIDAVTEFEEDRSAGVGGYAVTNCSVLRDFTMNIGGKAVTFPKILVSRQTAEGSVLGTSTLDLEFFNHQKKVTISYKCSRMVVE